MTCETFAAYIHRRRLTNSPIGDFLVDARDDAKLPDVKSWDALHSYLRTRQASPGMLRAARRVWNEYESMRRAAAAVAARRQAVEKWKRLSTSNDEVA